MHAADHALAIGDAVLDDHRRHTVVDARRIDGDAAAEARSAQRDPLGIDLRPRGHVGHRADGVIDLLHREHTATHPAAFAAAAIVEPQRHVAPRFELAADPFRSAGLVGAKAVHHDDGGALLAGSEVIGHMDDARKQCIGGWKIDAGEHAFPLNGRSQSDVGRRSQCSPPMPRRHNWPGAAFLATAIVARTASDLRRLSCRRHATEHCRERGLRPFPFLSGHVAVRRRTPAERPRITVPHRSRLRHFSDAPGPRCGGAETEAPPRTRSGSPDRRAASGMPAAMLRCPMPWIAHDDPHALHQNEQGQADAQGGEANSRTRCRRGGAFCSRMSMRRWRLRPVTAGRRQHHDPYIGILQDFLGGHDRPAEHIARRPRWRN